MSPTLPPVAAPALLPRSGDAERHSSLEVPTAHMSPRSPQDSTTTCLDEPIGLWVPTVHRHCHPRHLHPTSEHVLSQSPSAVLTGTPKATVMSGPPHRDGCHGFT